MTLSRKEKHYATLDQKNFAEDKKFWKTVKPLEKKLGHWLDALHFQFCQ